MTLNGLRQKLDESVTFADFATLALAFMACGALWWRVAASESNTEKLSRDIAPIILDYNATKVQALAQANAISDLKYSIDKLNGTITSLQIHLAQLEGALGLRTQSSGREAAP